MGSDQDVRAEARLILRQWLAADDAEVLARVDTLGRKAIAAAADASGRLERGVAAGQSAQASLAALQAIALRIDTPRPEPASLFRRRKPQEAEPSIDLSALVESLERERDAVARALIGLDTDRKRLLGAAAGLDDALELVRACARAGEAAAREIVGDRPDRARFLRETVAERLLAREQDIVTQAAVTQQGVLTLGVIAESQQTLVDTLARARDTSVAALRTALAARQAIAGSQSLAEQTAALDRTVGAAEAATGRGDVRRILDDALTQARAAINAVDAAARGAG